MATALPRIGQAVGDGAALAISCLVSYWLTTRILRRALFVSHEDELLGGMWDVVATVFVYQYNYQQTVRAALSRMVATSLSFALCLVYLLIFPFTPWGMAALIGLGTIALRLAGRSEDIVTTGITTAVVMVVAGINPQHAWKQPILRLLDTVAGICVGIAGAWIVRSLTDGDRLR